MASQKKPRNHDMSIMNTNNSCIVSKRSVEKIYHKDDQGFLRHFVKKFQRRSPLINRGYWLRMRAVEHTVRDFLSQANPEGKRKAVVNLGCGYDTLPWKLLRDAPRLCPEAFFVDVDHEQLVVEKCEVIRQTTALRALLFSIESPQPREGVILRSERYAALGCDLGDLNLLNRLKYLVDFEADMILFIAEVSMTYMDPESADGVVKWCSEACEGQFCLLEQFLPSGMDDPFAKTMLEHFKKLNSPIKPASRYRSLEEQESRFLRNGWSAANASSLWDVWLDAKIISCREREALNLVEPFDEWEEFVYFSSHYFLLTAKSASCRMHNNNIRLDYLANNAVVERKFEPGKYPQIKWKAKFHPNPRGKGRRRHGTSFVHKKSMLIHHGGHGIHGRLPNANVYSQSAGLPFPSKHEMPPAKDLTHHTITELQEGRHVLIGGRASPDRASRSCYLYNGQTWTLVAQLPQALYRHAVVPFLSGALVYGGKHNSTEISDKWYFWKPGKPLITIDVVGDLPGPRFGHCIMQRGPTAGPGDHAHAEGLISGGLTTDGRILSDLYSFRVCDQDGDSFRIKCENLIARAQFQNVPLKTFGRFGARAVSNGNDVLLVGGVCASGVLRREEDVLCLTPSLEVRPVKCIMEPRPILLGHEIQCNPGSGSLLFFGGGAVCFSFGSCWNEGLYEITDNEKTVQGSRWQLEDHREVQDDSGGPKLYNNSGRYTRAPLQDRSDHHTIAVPQQRPSSKEGLLAIINRRYPTTLKCLDIGPCLHLWSPGYLKTKIGFDRGVVIHSSSSTQMNFVAKNFKYENRAFGEFLDAVELGEKSYLRATSASKPTERATRLCEDFPEIAADFRLPPELHYVSENEHSSPLRVSGPVAMWLHYDVMANVLCQIRGSKRLLLFHPSDVNKLGFTPGASSSQFDAFDDKARSQWPFCDAQAFEAHLHPGDILYIPPFWPHTAAPTDGLSIAVNVFFRDMQHGYAAGKDIYGNRDLQAYENGRKDLMRVANGFKKLPGQAGKFYMQRLAAELGDMASDWT